MSERRSAPRVRVALAVAAALMSVVLVGASVTAGASTHAADASSRRAVGIPSLAPERKIPKSVRNGLRASLLRRLSAKNARRSCRRTRSFEHQIGATPLNDPSLSPAHLCILRVRLRGLRPDVAVRLDPKPTVLTAIVVFTDAPADDDTIAYQLGLGFDRPGVENRSIVQRGEGLVRVPNDLFFFVPPASLWAPIEPLDAGFAPTAVPARAWGFLQPELQMQGVLIEDGLLTPDTVLNLQVFGRQTATGQTPTPQDPAASALVPIGPLGACIESSESFTPCGGSVAAKRFEVQAAGGQLDAEEIAPGHFWFFEQDDFVVTAKVLDACSLPDQHFWVFMSGLTNVEVVLTVTDTQTEMAKQYTVDESTPSVYDPKAFDTCPP